MSKFKKKKSDGQPAISTASLPDIVFMLLFFFMVTTVMREVTLKVEIQTPKATEVDKLERKSLVSYIYIGEPIKALQGTFGTEPRIFLFSANIKGKTIWINKFHPVLKYQKLMLFFFYKAPL